MGGFFLPQCEEGDAAEAWTRPNLVAALWNGDDVRLEADVHELGQRVADGLDDENEGPDYRRFEREAVIWWRYNNARASG